MYSLEPSRPLAYTLPGDVEQCFRAYDAQLGAPRLLSAVDIPADAVVNFSGQFYSLSNFSHDRVVLTFKDGQTYNCPTSEHAFVLCKTTDPTMRAQIVAVPKASEVRAFGRDARNLPLRPDWEQVKVTVMERIVLAKALQHPRIGTLVLATGARMLVEGNTWKDETWGFHFPTQRGWNYLGRSWMKVRLYLSAHQHPSTKG